MSSTREFGSVFDAESKANKSNTLDVMSARVALIVQSCFLDRRNADNSCVVIDLIELTNVSISRFCLHTN